MTRRCRTKTRPTVIRIVSTFEPRGGTRVSSPCPVARFSPDDLSIAKACGRADFHGAPVIVRVRAYGLTLQNSFGGDVAPVGAREGKIDFSPVEKIAGTRFRAFKCYSDGVLSGFF